jgi:Carboxypeptidase regulatory-like domain/TonB dependent receptor-like, beta-barrel
MSSTVSRLLRITSYMFILLLGCVANANAQFRAIVQGSVTDAHGAAVVGANIVLINKETNRTEQSASSDQGFYRFDRLSPGKYMLVVEHTGFKKKVLADVDVRAEEAQGINIQLEPGEIIETVTVSAELSEQLKTENANIGRSITQQEILRLPQYGRDPYELVRLAPGIFGLGARDPCCRSVGFPNSVGPGSNNSIFQPENQVPVSANGQRPTANNYEVDGVSVNSQVWGGAAVVTPNQESVKELHVASNSYSAENGRTTGVLVQVVSRNGTNDFHGSAVFKYQDPALNAFNKWGGPFGGQPRRVEDHFRQWAGSIGGPIYLPRFAEGGPAYWSGKNKLFFFFSYETLRKRANNSDNRWIETPEFRQLLLSQRGGSLAARIVHTPGMEQRILSVQAVDCVSVGMVNPTTCRAVPGGLDIGAPTGSIGQRTTNSSGAGLDNVPDIRYAEVLFPSSRKSQQFSTRIDYQMTEHNLVVFSMYNTPNDTRFTPDGRPIQDFLSARRNTAGALLWSRTLSSTAINEARFNVTRWYLDEIKSNPNVPFGIPLVIASIPFYPFGIAWGPGDVEVLYQTSYNFRNILSKVIGNHGLKFGGEYADEQNNDVVAGPARPIYQFYNLWNFFNDAPDVEFGNFDPRSGIPTDVKKYIRARTYSLFAQDDWKVRSNLTLNLGLRWEYFSPLREKYGNSSQLLLGSGDSALVDATFNLGGEFFESDRNNFGPQIGFAWSPQTIIGINTNNRAVLRGGFGIGYNRIPESLSLNGRLNPPFVGNFVLLGGQTLFTLGPTLNAFDGWPSNPNTILRFDPKTHMPLTGSRPTAFATLQNVPNPYAYRYSLEAQFELGHSWIASLGYQGSTGHKFPRVVNYSLFVPPNLNLGSASLLLTDVNSNFNAMLAQLSHRFAKGFDLHAQYRWSKSIDTCSYDDRCQQTYPFDQSTERGPSDYDVTHYFTASGLWDLPIFKNRRDFVGKALRGWQVNGIITSSSGFPWTPVYGNCLNLIKRDFLCPLRPVAYRGGLKQDTSNEAFLRADGTFGISDASKFFVPPPGGNVAVPPQPGIGRNVFRGPRYFSVDVSVVKRVSFPKFARLGEAAGLDLRANFFNVFNTLNLAPFQFGSLSTLIDSRYFGRATDALAGRVVEFQARFFF